MQKSILILSLILLWGFGYAAPGYAQEQAPDLKEVIKSGDAEAPDTASANHSRSINKLVKKGPDDEYNRGVPRTSVEGYFQAMEVNDLERAAKYLDLRNLPSGLTVDDGPELARQLKVVLDRSLWVEMDLLSTDEHGHSDDGLPSYRDLVGTIEANQRAYDILLQRIPRGDGVYIWAFSSKTVAQIPALYAAKGYGPIGEKLARILPDYGLFGLKLWQWVLLLIILLVATVIVTPITRLISWPISKRDTPLALLLAKFIRGPLTACIVVILLRENFELIQPSITAQAYAKASTIYILVMTWLLIRLVRLAKEYWSVKLTREGRPEAVVLLRPALTTVNIFIVLFALLIWLDNIGFSVTTVLAGLGIGGIAIALATQKSIENFIGAITLYLAAPVKVGDFCRVGDMKGVVEEIGLRATKLRTLENTLIIITNAELSNLHIENISQRTRFRFNPLLRLHHATSADQLRFVLRELKKLLIGNQHVAESPLRVRYVGFADYSLDIEINCYIETTDINTYKAITEAINLEILDLLERAGTCFAVPASIEYNDSRSWSDTEAKQRAESAIADIRQRNDSDIELSEQELGALRPG